jgi:16S rRNA C967 or C1407 C5-methylase (RsmB/RsmF family)
LGLRPKLYVAQQTLRELEKHSEYQRKFVDQAVQLLKPGGLLTYSTCTMNALENEHVVKYVLDTHPAMELVPIKVTDGAESRLGRPGLEGFGLNDQQRMMVRRFDPGDPGQNTMGFFVALFRKRGYGH